MKSIGARIRRAILCISLASVAVMVLSVLIVNEDLEQTMLAVEFSEEREFFLGMGGSTEPIVWETPNLAIVHVPSGSPLPADMPQIFKGLPTNTSAEITRNGETYLVRIESASNGIFYMAKNITHFEEREALFEMALGVLALLIVGFSLLLGVFSSRRIVDPLRRLSEQIQAIPVGANMPSLPADYRESELATIAETFNRFLNELESYVAREQSLLSLASHELRTPIAVISGALDVLEQRGQLQANDAATVARLRTACDEMRRNTEVLLKLARREEAIEEMTRIDVDELISRTLDDLSADFDINDRVVYRKGRPITLIANATMARMLLRNLIHNALKHTNRQIEIGVKQGIIRIADSGTGLDAHQKSILKGQRRLGEARIPTSGLGLYIVTLMSERIGWRIEIEDAPNGGTTINLHTGATKG